jgi:bacterioferritin
MQTRIEAVVFCAAPMSAHNGRRSTRCSGTSMDRSDRIDAAKTIGAPMKSDPQVIVHLNAQLKNELTATNQYFLHYRMLKHWGFDKLAKKEYAESIGEMKHADRLMERIFMLDGLPNLQDLGKLLIGENVPELLSCDLQSETGAQATIKDGIAYCESVRDYVSRDILQTILDDTEEHIDFLETQIDVLGKVGLENYLQSQMGDAS